MANQQYLELRFPYSQRSSSHCFIGKDLDSVTYFPNQFSSKEFCRYDNYRKKAQTVVYELHKVWIEPTTINFKNLEFLNQMPFTTFSLR